MNLASSLRFSISTSSARSPCLPPRRRRTIPAAGRGVDGGPKFGASAGPSRLPSPIGPPYRGCPTGRRAPARAREGSAEGALAAAADPDAVGEPDEQRDQRDRGEDREADDRDAGGDARGCGRRRGARRRRPSRRRRAMAEGVAGLDPQRDSREAGAVLEVVEQGARGARPRRRSARSWASTASRSASVSAPPSSLSSASIRALESCSSSPAPTVGAVMSVVPSWRERTSAISEKRGERVVEPGARDQQLEARPGVAVAAAVDRGAEDDAVGGVDGFEDLAGGVVDRRRARCRGRSRPSVRRRGGGRWRRTP